jgi:branched-chain amino acid aminotransferase
MDAKVLYLNGAYVPAEQGVIPVGTHAFAYGTGCFEGMQGYWNELEQQVYLFRMREHCERLLRSCKILQITLPYSADQLVDISVEMVRRNGYREDVSLRPVAYKGDTSIGVRLHGLQDRFVLTAVPLGNDVDVTGLRCCVSSWRRIDAIPARVKICGAYTNSALAKSEAQLNGFDEAIMLTTVIELASRELGLATRERVIGRTELYSADEIFMVGTSAQIAPVVSVDHRPIGDGNVGRVQQRYFDTVRGQGAGYRDRWRTPPLMATRPGGDSGARSSMGQAKSPGGEDVSHR